MSSRLYTLLIFSTATCLSACGDSSNPGMIKENNTAKMACTMNVDNNNDGKTDSTDTYTLNSNGHRLSDEYDINADGVAESRTTLSYDAQDNEVKLELDTNADGTANTTIETTYDGKNRPLTVDQDADGDGKTDYSYSFSYPNSHTTITKLDKNKDGTVDSITTSLLDEQGRSIRDDNDLNNDGKVDSITYYSYENDNKNPTNTTYDDNADGTFDRSESANSLIEHTTTTQDGNGNWASETDNNNDGIIDARIITSCKDFTQ